MSLQNWLNNGWLTEHRTSLQEITATATLAASGYRAVRDAHHYRVIQSLAHTIKADAGLIALRDGEPCKPSPPRS